MNSRAVAFGGVGYGGRSIAFDGFVVPAVPSTLRIGNRRAIGAPVITRTVDSAQVQRIAQSLAIVREVLSMQASRAIDAEQETREIQDGGQRAVDATEARREIEVSDDE